MILDFVLLDHLDLEVVNKCRLHCFTSPALARPNLARMWSCLPANSSGHAFS